MLASSPKLKKLSLIGDGLPEHVHLRGQTLECVIFWLSASVEVVVAGAPSLERLIMWRAPLTYVNFASATGLKVLGYFELGADKLRIEDTVIEVLSDDLS